MSRPIAPHPAALPRPLPPATIAKLRRLAESHGVRRAAEAVGVSRHVFLVAVAALALDNSQREAVTNGVGRLTGEAGGR
jgi:hypothetical protein